MNHRLAPLTVILLVLHLFLLGELAHAADERDVVSSSLPYPEGLRPQVDFWKKVFGENSKNEVIIHDSRYVDKIYVVLDFATLVKEKGERVARKIREKRISKEKRRIRAALRALHKGSRGAATNGSLEAKIQEMFKDVNRKGKYRRAAQKGRIRAQSGMRERFLKAIQASGKYLATMEDIFREAGLPIVLTRLPLIESSFEINAYSRAHAAGIWQFIPSTGRVFLRIDHTVDQRLDPLLATRAAAKLLKSNHERLKTWPLAVTAYNHGAAGMERAVRKLGTRDITEIIRRYRGRRFGFASRNFYPELLAAIEIEKHSDRYFGNFERDPPLLSDQFVLPHYVGLSDLASAAKASKEELVDLNPSLGKYIQAGQLDVPRSFPLRIPYGTKQDFLVEYEALGPTAKSTEQRSAFVVHRVKRGETLGGIAHRYGTGIRNLQRLNGIKNAQLIRIGQHLRVLAHNDTRGGRSLAGNGDPVATHRVRSGESLSEIAAFYNTKVSYLKRINDIRDISLIRAGEMLQVRGDGASRQIKKRQVSRHRVRRGETLGGIASRYRTSIARLQALNAVSDVDRLRVGQVLKIPSRN